MTTAPTLPTPSGRSVRELIAELAGTEDALREGLAAGSAVERGRVARRQAGIVRELRRRRPAGR
ncbi:hypothetical protein [Phycicoccus avicenniae]|uniref:hypothetical protein n=1 Tax=Phycicoccus avicenniae TaxID=2828860 RepID=UPI003D28A602